MKRFLLYAVFLLCLPSLAHYWCIVRFHHSTDNSIIAAKVYCSMCGLNGDTPVPRVQGSYCTCHGFSVILSRIALSSSPCDPQDDPQPMLDFSGRLGDYYGDLPSGKIPAIDYGGMGNLDPSNPMIPFYPNGSVITGDDGAKYVATDSPDGESRYGSPFSGGTARGYQGGKAGTYTYIPGLDGASASSSFTADWTGGVSQSGFSSALSSDPSPISVVAYGGGGGSGGGGSSGSPVFDEPSSVSVSDGNGGTYNVINVPRQTVTLDNGSSITLYDYSSLLNAIGANVSSGFNKLHDDLDTINENQRKQLESDEDVSVAENTDPSVDTSSVESEAQEQLDIITAEGSGWRFDFGLGSNPIGNLITSFFGNPPTNFGTQDNICHISFDLPLVGTLEYEFNFSDWFPSAFRSCLLMILTIVFAIASAKAVSGAFQ